MPAASIPLSASSVLLPILLTVVVVGASANPAQAGALYKWVDEDGQVRYSDRLPPSQNKKKHQQLNSQGVVLSTREAAKSDKELAAEAEKKLKLEQEEALAAQVKAVQDNKDKVLLLTFSTDEELGLAHKGRVEVLDSVIKLINKSLVSTQQTLDELHTRAETIYLSQGKNIPGGLAQRMEHFTRKLESRSAQLELKMLEKARINQQYELDLARFRELKSGSN